MLTEVLREEDFMTDKQYDSVVLNMCNIVDLATDKEIAIIRMLEGVSKDARQIFLENRSNKEEQK